VSSLDSATLAEQGSGGLGSGGDADKVRAALADLLQSRPFRKSQQCCSLLRYIVEHSLSGEESLLRERVIGAEIFGRPADYETSADPIVRLRAAEVRKRLAQYYASLSDSAELKIDIPSGSYRAVFHLLGPEFPSESVARAAPVAGDLAPAGLAESSQPSARSNLTSISARRYGPYLWAAIAALLLVCAAVWQFRFVPPETKSFRVFWAPWLNSSKPAILSIGSNAVYRLQYSYADRYAQQHGLEEQGQEFYVPFGKDQPLSTNDIYPAQNGFVALGDVAAVSNISASLARQNHAFQQRFPNDVSFAEIRTTPSVLVGGFNNPMTVELTKHLPFVMLRGSEIMDSSNPKRKWLLNVSQDPHNTADYAILTRLVQNNGDAPLMSVAGLGQYGTMAAAELICSPSAVYRMSRQLPSDWASKNLQAVLRIEIVDFKPSVTGVVAYRSW